jgi:hypothetical protein
MSDPRDDLRQAFAAAIRNHVKDKAATPAAIKQVLLDVYDDWLEKTGPHYAVTIDPITKAITITPITPLAEKCAARIARRAAT